MLPAILHHLLPRLVQSVSERSNPAHTGGNFTTGVGSDNSTEDQFLALIASPFESQISSTSFLSALVFYGSTTVAIVLTFCFVRPRCGDVYEPRASRPGGRATPLPLPEGPFGWLAAVFRTSETETVAQAGTDGAVFLRFVRMLRDIFTVLTVLVCALLIPLNVLAPPVSHVHGLSFFSRLTPQYLGGRSTYWAYVAAAYLVDAVVCSFLWHNYRAVARLRGACFASDEYRNSWHARTLLVTDVPVASRRDHAIAKLVGARDGRAIGPDAEGSPVEDCDGDRMADQEEVGAKAKETTKRTPPRDGSAPLSYGFATFASVRGAHAMACLYRNRGPERTVIRLAAHHSDRIRGNLGLSETQRRRRDLVNRLCVVLLTFAWVVPNVLIAVFLSNLSHLGLVWPAFQKSLLARPTAWGIVQGIFPPAITCLFYFFLPKIFRRWAERAGDITKTSRERHVTQKLFSFFLFNHLVVFSLFSTFWAFGAALLNAGRHGVWRAAVVGDPFGKVVSSLITVAPYWCSWLLQRNLGAAIDLGQLVSLTGALRRRFLRGTPDDRVDPRPFDYASYYNYFLFYAAVALCFGALQPLALAVTCLYLWLDAFAKKYMLLYIFVTHHESGGMFWPTLYNRMLVNLLLCNVVIALLVTARGGAGQRTNMLVAMLPLPVLLGVFKCYCCKTFDDAMHYSDFGGALLKDGIRARQRVETIRRMSSTPSSLPKKR